MSTTTPKKPMGKHLMSDLGAGIGAIVWAILAVDTGDGAGPLVPQLAALCSSYMSGGFGFMALGRWYNTRRKDGAGRTDAG